MSALTPPADLSEQHLTGHLVGFYESESFLTDLLADFLSSSLERDESALVIATRDHRDRFVTALEQRGHDVAGRCARGQLVWLDAHRTLSELLDGERLDARRFQERAAPMVEHLAARGRPVRVFGEMVSLLREEGNVSASLALEDLWNAFGATTRALVLCAYPMQLFAADDSDAAFDAVCVRHSAITNEGYSQLGPDADDTEHADTKHAFVLERER